VSAILAAWAAIKNIPAWLWVALVVSLFLAVYGFEAYRFGSASSRIDTLKASVQALHERKDTDAEVHSLDDAGLCVALGGLRDECSGL
jgi:hypothetical protein